MCLQTSPSLSARGLPVIRSQPVESQHCPAPASVTAEDVQTVHTLVEYCILRGMTKQQTVTTLQAAGVHPAFAIIVWEKLEAQNQAFFVAYQRLLRLKARNDCMDTMTFS